MESVSEFYRGRSVLVTGASGFIGKQLVEKLLRSCPDIDKIYMLLRPTRFYTAPARLQYILSSPLFVTAKAEQSDLDSKLVVVQGDIADQCDLGIDDAIKARLLDDVSVVFHLAATVSFNEPLRVAVSLNIAGLRNVLQLCKRMSKLETFVHASTAFSNCVRTDIEEVVYEPPLTPTQILTATEWMSDSMLEDITADIIRQYPNTYTFTKAIAERLLLDERGHVPAVIFRPSIVSASLKEPISGWVDNLNGCSGVLAGIGSGFIKAVYGGRHKLADLVPVDLTANALITIAWHNVTHRTRGSDEVAVYHFTSGELNGITWHQVGKLITPALRKYPMENFTWIPKGYITENWLWYLYSKYFDIYVRLLGLDLIRCICGKKARLIRIHRTVCRMMRLLEYFTCREWNWTNNNIRQLLNDMSPADRHTFNVDVTTINWPTYFDSYCLGIRQYTMNQSSNSLPDARRFLRGLVWLRRVGVLCLLVVSARLVISRLEAASQLWRLTMSLVTALLQRMPRITHS